MIFKPVAINMNLKKAGFKRKSHGNTALALQHYVNRETDFHVDPAAKEKKRTSSGHTAQVKKILIETPGSD